MCRCCFWWVWRGAAPAPVLRVWSLAVGLIILAVHGGGARCEGAEPEKPRAARSVHLAWESPPADAFLLGVRVRRTVPGSFFMVCGWQVGYFGLQELVDGGRVVLMSVWDDARGDDPSAVAPELRVETLARGEAVRVRRFGGEGTGGQAMLTLPWREGTVYWCLVWARVEGDRTRYAGWVREEGSAAWRHVVTFRTRTGGRALTGLYSFIEDFRRDGRSAGEERRALFVGGWVRDAEGRWRPLQRARFTASTAEWEARDSIFAGLADDGFELATGGSVRPDAPLGSTLERPVSEGEPPRDLPEEP